MDQREKTWKNLKKIQKNISDILGPHWRVPGTSEKESETIRAAFDLINDVLSPMNFEMLGRGKI